MELWLRFRLFTLLSLLCAAVVLYTYIYIDAPQSGSDIATIAIFDVGQGDAALITTPRGAQIVIDGGPDSSVLTDIAALLPRFDRTLDMVVLTHFDADHAAGLLPLLERYEVAHIVYPEPGTDERSLTAVLLDAFAAEGAVLHVADAGMEFQFGSSTLTILSPQVGVPYRDSNDRSVVTWYRYGEVDVLFSGDASSAIEENLVRSYGSSLTGVELLKLGHHGSKTASSESYLRFVSPQVAVVSAGADNRYGHPHELVVSRLAALAIPLLRTDAVGSIFWQSDGVSLWRVE